MKTQLNVPGSFLDSATGRYARSSSKRSNLALLLTAAVAAVGLLSTSAATLLAPGQSIIGVAAAPGSSTSDIAVVGGTAGANNYPAGESPELAIDGETATTYLNFAKTNTGLIVTVPGETTTVSGFQFSTANDTPDRDPLIITIEGTTASNPSNAAMNATWTLLYSGPSGLAADPGRSAAGTPISFSNAPAFNTYRVLITDVRNPAAATSVQFSEVQFFGVITDTTPPTVGNTVPSRGAVVRNLLEVEVLFNEPVDGVDASDLLVNGIPATDISFGTPNQFIFSFPQPATGTVTIAFAPGHGIRDQAPVPNAFAGDSWIYTLNPNAAFFDVRINEFMADNANGIRDEDGSRQDWIELYNGGATPVNLAGWFLTDDAANLGKWQFPTGVQMAPNSYLLIWASSKNRLNIGALHTNFKLEKNGEFLGLVLPDTNTVVSMFAPTYPVQRTDVSYGRDRLTPSIVGFYDVPTPNAANAVSGRTGFAPDVSYSLSSRTFVTPFNLTLSTTTTNAVIRYILITNATQASASLTNVPTTNSPIYTGAIPINVTTEVRARAFQTGLFPGTPVTENYVQINSDVRNMSSDIPMVVVHMLGKGSVPALATEQGSGILMAFDNENRRSSLTNAPQVATRMGIHIRGSSTINNPKSNYRFEFWDEFNQDNKFPFLGMPSDSDWVLYGVNQFDPGLMHNAIYQWLGKQVGIPSMRNRYVEVFRKIDNGPVTTNDYFGLYLLLETPKVGKNRLDITELRDQDTNATAITGGYLMKIDRVDTERNFSPPTIGGIRPPPSSIAFVDPAFKTTETDPRRVAQINYFQDYINRFLTNLSSPGYTNPVTGYAQFIDPDQWVNHLLANVIPFNVDGYRLSGYFYKERNSRLQQGPMWDCDRCLGTGGTTTPNGDNRCFSPRFWRLPATDVNTDNGTDFFGISNVGVSWFTPLFRDPDFWQRFIDSYQRYRTNEYSSNSIVAMINGFYTEIKEAQVREQARWGPVGFTWPRSGVQTVNGYTFDFGPADNFNRGRFTNEVNFQKKWLMDRLEFLDTNFLNLPTLSFGTALVPSGTMVTAAPATKANSILLYTLNGTDPRALGGGVSPSALMSSGPLTLTITDSVRLFARSYNSSHSNLMNSGPEVGKPLINSFWSGPVAATYYTAVPSLRITEILYHPAPPPLGDTNDADNFEYIELKNIGQTTLNLAGFNLSGGIDFTFTNFTLASGDYCVVVKNVAAFQSRYGVGPAIAGVFAGNLANDGDHVVLRGPLQEPIQDFVYQDSWYPLTDDLGFSLVVQDETADSNLSTNTSWRSSSGDGGSPGASNPPPIVVSGVVLVNEALTHTDPPPPTDTIELFNPGASDMDIGGWWLTDDFNTPKKYEIPAGTIIPAGGYILFNESQFNPTPGMGGSFALGSDGDQVYVFSGTNGFITGYYHGVDFGAAQNGRTFGRYINSQTNEHFVAQAANTLGGSNSRPFVGPIVISEIMYHPPEASGDTGLVDNSVDEFIELYNLSTTNVPLYHVLYPSNTWKLTSAVDFAFPPGATVAPTSFVLVVSFDPAIGGTAFRARYGVPANVPIYGPYIGKLDNSAESVRLRRPDSPNGPNVPYILVDQVDYGDVAPWKFEADGLGASLQRLVRADYGNDVTNWVAAGATPGSALLGGEPPVIVQQPMDVTVVEGMTTNIFVVVSSASAVSYQWQQNSNTVPGATGATLVFSNAQLNQAGLYRVGVFNGGGSTFSTSAMVTVRSLPKITQQPTNQNVQPGTNVTLAVTVMGTGVLRYQWQYEGVDIMGATNFAYSFTNATLPIHHGNYRVMIVDDVGSATSATVFIYVMVKPAFLLNPTPVTVLAGGTARFTAIATGAPPIYYRWLRQGAPVTTNTSGILVITNVQAPSGTIRVLATNLASGPSGQSMVPAGGVQMTVLPDADRDGISDLWETNFFGSVNTTNNANNALEDPDGDTMINRDEYIAGTNPTNGASYLKIERPLIIGGAEAVLQFDAVSNRNYTLDFRNTLESGLWTNLFAIPSATNNRTIRLTNSISAPTRLYRVTIPAE